MKSSEPILALLVQVSLIIGLSRVMGMVFARLRQPQVIGEILAGIMLGPTLLGWVWPAASDWIFPPASLPPLGLLSQLGVIFFLFLIGLEFDPAVIRNKGRAAALISISSVAIPFAFGIALTYYLYSRVFTGLTENDFRASALFMGAAISVTAFPVLARILSERSLHRTRVGVLSLTAAAVNDVLAWCILALVVAVARYEGPAAALRTAGLATVYVLVMFFIVRPLLGRLQAAYERQGQLSYNIVAIIFLLLCASAWATERIGIHALFGAFLLGSIMPKQSSFVRHLSEKIEHFTVIFMLPIFFAYTGLLTDLRDVFSANMIGYTVLIVAVACAGKYIGAAGAAMLTGSDLREASAVGVLMNTRGLMELVILKMGLDLGVINDLVFSMMVIMALVTTAMTTPLLHAVYPRHLLVKREAELRRALPPGAPSVLIPVSLPRSGGPLLYVADLLTGHGKFPRSITALYLRRPSEREAYDSVIEVEQDPATLEALRPLMQEAQRLEVEVDAVSQVSREVPDDIAAIAEVRGANLILMGFHKPVIGTALLGGTVHKVLTRAAGKDVAILFDRGLREVRNILVPYLGSMHDRFAIELADRIARGTRAKVTVLHVVPPQSANSPETLQVKAELQKALAAAGRAEPVEFRIVESDQPVDVVLDESSRHDLVIIGVAEQWGLESQLFGWRSERIARDCPTPLLVVRRGQDAEAALPAPADSPAPPPATVL